MDHDYISYLRDHNPTVRLLRLDNAPLIISFLYFQFKKNGRALILSNELTTNLADYQYSLRSSGARTGTRDLRTNI
jgi:hypothetical protein